MDHQTMFNFVIGLICTMMGWWLNNIWTSLKELQSADRELAEKVGELQIVVAGQYVTREEFNNVLSQVFTKLDKIIDAVNRKADR